MLIMRLAGWIDRLFTRERKLRSRDGRRESLAVEVLEPRLALAGNVVASLSGGTLTIAGDDQANDFTVERVGSSVVVTGNHGTTIALKGQKTGAASQTFAVADFTKLSLNIGGKGGADRITVGSSEPASDFTFKGLTLDSGAGADYIRINNVRLLQGGTNKITLGSSRADNDYLEINGLNVFGGLDVVTGGGDDYVHFEVNTAVTKRLLLDLGAGNDIAGVDSGFYGSLDVKLGDGVDDFRLGFDTSAGKPLRVGGAAKFDGGNDVNRFIFDFVQFGSSLSLKGGAALDLVTFRQLSVVSTTTIDVGNGENFVGFDGATFHNALTLKSGTGNDAFLFQGNFNVNGKLLATTGAGNDYLEMGGAGVVTGSFDAQFGGGNNTLVIETLAAYGGFIYSGGAGIDWIGIEHGLTTKSLSVRLGAGDDFLGIDGLAKSNKFDGLDKVDVDAGAGHDTVTVASVFAKELRINLGAGNDALTAVNVFASIFAQIDGGTNSDTGYLSGQTPSLSSKRKFAGFEIGNLAPAGGITTTTGGTLTVNTGGGGAVTGGSGGTLQITGGTPIPTSPGTPITIGPVLGPIAPFLTPGGPVPPGAGGPVLIGTTVGGAPIISIGPTTGLPPLTLTPGGEGTTIGVTTTGGTLTIDGGTLGNGGPVVIGTTIGGAPITSIGPTTGSPPLTLNPSGGGGTIGVTTTGGTLTVDGGTGIPILLSPGTPNILDPAGPLPTGAGGPVVIGGPLVLTGSGGGTITLDGPTINV